ncbi:ribonuclease R family protein, partial [Planctomycetota bacterium]
RYGFVVPQQAEAEGELFIPAKAMGNAMSGDRVLAQIKRRRAGRDEERLTGKIVRVLERAHSSVVGMLERAGERWVVQPDGGETIQPIVLEAVDGRHVRVGDKVAVAIRSYPTSTSPARGTITQVLGRTGSYETEIAAIIRRYGLYDCFDESALVQAVNARTAFDPTVRQGREDLTGALIITIDPPEAQDFDDAISLTLNAQGFWVLGVHIADVCYFVPADSALDRAARVRGNTVYLPGHTLPMLPEVLSNGVCSLQPHEPRYTKSVFLSFNKDGEVSSARFANTVIQSKARLTYQEVDEILKGKIAGDSPEVTTLLQNLEKLARLIERRRRRQGLLQLQMSESEVLLDSAGRVYNVQPKDTSYPHTMIEMFMVEANVAVARLLDRLCVPFMRRIHPEPERRALQRLSQTLRLLGVTLARRPGRKDFQKLLAQVHQSKLELPVNLLVLRSLAKATYTPSNTGHYALATSTYCHFTSPIRRYADLLVHRALQGYLTGHVEQARRGMSFASLVDIGEHISATEQKADTAEQEVKTIFILHLLRDHLGKTYQGVVTSLSRFGVSVHLPTYGVEGQVPCEALGPDIWHFDEQSQCLTGRHTGAIVRLAQPLRVRIIAVHPAAGQLDLVPACELTLKNPRATL